MNDRAVISLKCSTRECSRDAIQRGGPQSSAGVCPLYITRAVCYQECRRTIFVKKRIRYVLQLACTHVKIIIFRLPPIRRYGRRYRYFEVNKKWAVRPVYLHKIGQRNRTG